MAILGAGLVGGVSEQNDKVLLLKLKSGGWVYDASFLVGKTRFFVFNFVYLHLKQTLNILLIWT